MYCCTYYRTHIHASLSARRAWIEMSNHQAVDFSLASLSARRAWIEIELSPWGGLGGAGRSPQGERG